MYCSKCGANVAEGAAFCNACGQSMATTLAAPPAGVPPVAVAPPAYTPPAQASWQVPAARPVAYAGFWLRFVALIIDVIVIGFVGWIVTLPLVASLDLRGIFAGYRTNSPEELIPLMGVLFKVFVIRLVLQWLYFALLESSAWQATLGKKALGLEVTDLSGNRIGFGRASGRFFGKILSGLILWIGFIMAGFTEKKQALHDILAGTLVIRKL
jgi:uncharacterized RDD family membrane protein YckC